MGFVQDRNRWPVTVHQPIAILNCLLHGDKRSKRVATLFHPVKSPALAAPTSEAASVMHHLNLPSIISLTLNLSGLQSFHFHLSSQTIFSRTVHSKSPQNSHISFNRAQSGWTVSSWRATRPNTGRDLPSDVQDGPTLRDGARNNSGHARRELLKGVRPEVSSISFYNVKTHGPNGLWWALLHD